MARNFRDFLRNLLNVRSPRKVPGRGSRPHVGARIFRRDLRMTVQAGMTEDLWRWLQEAGWREITRKPDRRRYRDIPTDGVAELIDCAREDRARVLEQIIRRANEG